MDWWNTFWAFTGDPTFWATLVGKLIAVVLIVVGALVVRWLLLLVIDRVVRRIVTGAKKGRPGDDTQAIAAATPLAAVRIVQRTRTLGSVLSNIVSVIIFILAVLLIVNTIDKSILGSFALLSAAVGAGLGFGAQNIVRDVLNGIFMVVEDQLGVGDVVDSGPATGMVESVGIRVTQIRDVNGTLWYVRNGEIVRVGNMSQGWARVIIDLTVPADNAVDQVQTAALGAAEAMATSGKWRSRILEKPQSWGLASVSGDEMIIRLVVKVIPSARDDVARELRMRVKQAMEDAEVPVVGLNNVVLEGFAGATSVKGARSPKTKPTPLPSIPVNTAPRFGWKRTPKPPQNGLER